MDLFSEIEAPEREELRALRKELEEQNYKYYVLNQPTMSDREFDEKMHRLQALEAQQHSLAMLQHVFVHLDALTFDTQCIYPMGNLLYIGRMFTH